MIWIHMETNNIALQYTYIHIYTTIYMYRHRQRISEYLPDIPRKSQHCSRFWTPYFLHKSSSNWRQFSMKSLTVMSLSPTSPDNKSHFEIIWLGVRYFDPLTFCSNGNYQIVPTTEPIFGCPIQYCRPRLHGTKSSLSGVCQHRPAPSECSTALSAQQHPRPRHLRPAKCSRSVGAADSNTAPSYCRLQLLQESLHILEVAKQDGGWSSFCETQQAKFC